MEFLGFIVIIFFTALAAQLTMTISSNPDFVAILNNISPALGANSTVIGWVSAGAVAIAGIMIPMLMVKKDCIDGRDRLAEVGVASYILSKSFFVSCFALFVLTPCIVYLLTMFWFFVTNLPPTP